ncbi:MAG: two-component regulator propeller domain-containing protein [Syntrophothermus sp.]
MKYIIYLILLFYFPSFAQLNDFQFRQLKVEDGLSQTTILSIIQDKKGYMWFGTGNGLNKYDGYNFTVFSNNPNDSTSISNNAITSLYEDKDGFIWIGTIDGILNKYDRVNDVFFRYKILVQLENTPIEEEEYYEYPIAFSRNNSNSITSIEEDNNGNLWIGTWGKGLFIFNKVSGSIKHYTSNLNDNTSLSNNRIHKILIDNDNIAWIATLGGGLNRAININNINKITFEFIKKNGNDGISDNRIISIFEDNNNNLWVGTYLGGLNFLSANNKKNPVDKLKFKVYKHIQGNNSLSNNSVMAILQDHNNYLWVGTFGGGLDRYDISKNTFLNFKNKPLDENSIADNDVLSLCEDRSGIIWIGTNLGAGVSKLERNKIKFKIIKNVLNDKNSLSDDVIWAIYKDEENSLWIGTYRGGLNKYEPSKNKFTVYKNSSSRGSLSDNHIRSISEDNYGYLWVGTYSNGLNKFNKKSGKVEEIFTFNSKDKYSIGSNQIQNIFIEGDNAYIGTFGGGLNKLNIGPHSDKKFIRYIHKTNDPTSISDDRVYCIYRDREGKLWIGTFGGGLNLFDERTGKFTSFKNNSDDNKSLSNDRVISIHEDSRGYLWIGTYGGGLNQFDKNTKTFTRYYSKDKIYSEVIYGVFDDNNYNLWMSSNNGVFKLNMKNGKILHYDIEDGLQSKEFSGGAYFQSKDGEIYFGGIKGLNYFYPDSINENTHVPQIVINNVKVFNKPLRGEKKEVELLYNENYITFEFSSLDYSDPKSNQYQYMLEGIDKEWQSASSEYRIASYTNLAPGTYTFKVRGSNNDEIWNEAGESLIIKIKAPFWQTWWFIVFLILIIGGTVYYISTTRYKNKLAIEKLKTKLAADLHDSIGSGLTEISILSELTANEVNNNGFHSQNLINISETARHLIDNMSDIVWVVNPQRDTLSDLIIRLKDHYSDLLASLNISFKVNSIDDMSHIKLPMEYKQNLYLLLKEGINNAIKHSNCKRIVLDVNLEENKVLTIKLKDDGIGLDSNNIEYGNGIKNIKNRAKQIGGSAILLSKIGEGTEIVFRGKIGKLNLVKTVLTN